MDLKKLRLVPNDKVRAEEAVKLMLQFMGHDADREGLKETPKRYIKFMDQFCSPDDFEFTSFENDGTKDMVVVDSIPFFSLCEHHLAPFFGIGAIAYIPDGKLVGLSKLPRTLDWFARRPQNQERIGMQVADYIQDKLKPKGVAVILRARHLCIEMRGIKKSGVFTTTSCMRGIFETDASLKAEFMSIVQKTF